MERTSFWGPREESYGILIFYHTVETILTNLPSRLSLCEDNLASHALPDSRDGLGILGVYHSGATSLEQPPVQVPARLKSASRLVRIVRRDLGSQTRRCLCAI